MGCIVPAIPGPPLSYLALIFLSYAKDWEPFSQAFLIVMAILAVFLVILDYMIPLLGAKKYGASRWGIWFSMIGMIVGLLTIPPWGVFIGAFLGAVVGELLSGKTREEILIVGWGVFLSNMFGMGLKLAYSGFIMIVYTLKMF